MFSPFATIWRNTIMRKPTLLTLAAVLLAGVSFPALADWDRIGTYDIGFGPDRESHSPDFGGPVERLRFTARGGDIGCGYIRATFGNGNTMNLYSGELREGADRAIDLPGDKREVSRISFNCHAFSRGGARLEMAADIGSYRSRWMQNPNWERTWSRFMNWSRDTYREATGGNWQFMGSVQFRGRHDEQSSFTGWRGRNVFAIGLKPVHGDAVCRRVQVTFGHGDTRTFAANNGEPMREGRVYGIDMPGDLRNVRRLDLDCHAIGEYVVTVNILGR
jgi:hypothetical protein